MKKQTVAIVLSAGVGKRMNSSVPKQYLKVGDKEVIYYTLKAFEESNVDKIIIVAGKNDIDYCNEEIVKKNNLHKVVKVVAGGEERYESVLNGLKAISEIDELQETEYVLIHDGARPCIYTEDINHTIECVKEKKACIVAVRTKDTIKVVRNGVIVDSPRRDELWQAQTPQAFEYKNIFKAYSNLVTDDNVDLKTITDDASVWSLYNNIPVAIYEGDYFNIKITTPEDLEIVKEWLQY